MLPTKGASIDRQPSRMWRNIVEPIYHTARGAAHCVAGRGPGTQHRKKSAGEKERVVAFVAVDYCFLRNVFGGDYVPVIVMKDCDTRLLARGASEGSRH